MLFRSSYFDYEGAQQRVLGVFQKWEWPASLRVHQFLVRVGEFGGYAVIETNQPADIHRLSTVFAVFRFRLEPVMEVGEAVATETAAMAWRAGLSN